MELDDLQLRIEERLYSLETTKLEELGNFIKVNVLDQQCRRHRVRKVRQKFEAMVEEHVEEGDLKTFLESVLANMGDETRPARGTGEELTTKEAESTWSAAKTQSTGTQDSTIPKWRDVAELFTIRREFKIAGSIGGEGQKDRLSFIGLMRQIDAGLSKSYEEKMIVDAVIRAIS